MSAYLVDVETIDAIVSAWISLGDPRSGWSPSAGPSRTDRQERANEIGRLLWRANLDNLTGLYPSASPRDLPAHADVDALPEPLGLDALVGGYTFTACPIEPERIRLLFGRILKIVASYEYQSCDADAWSASRACAFVEALRLEIIGRLPGYAAGPWGTTDRNVFTL